MIEFWLNDQKVQTHASPGMGLLEFIRKHKHLNGSKLVCQEGECGACTMLVGKLYQGSLTYRSMTACIMPLINAHHKHIVTIEGLNLDTLSPVQQAMVAANGTQCGFCTPGFVVAMTAGILNGQKVSTDHLIQHMDGNICRCTGYKSIERAADRVVGELAKRPKNQEEYLPWLVQEGFLPSHFLQAKARLSAFDIPHAPPPSEQHAATVIGGGSDLMVQRPHQIASETLTPIFDMPALQGITLEAGICEIGAATTMTELAESPIIQRLLPSINDFLPYFASHQLRNMSTVGREYRQRFSDWGFYHSMACIG